MTEWFNAFVAGWPAIIKAADTAEGIAALLILAFIVLALLYVNRSREGSKLVVPILLGFMLIAAVGLTSISMLWSRPEVISNIHAQYGPPSELIWYSAEFTAAVQRTCDKKRDCTLTVGLLTLQKTYPTLRDPAFNVHKVVQVDFNCGSKIRTAYLLDDRLGHLWCS